MDLYSSRRTNFQTFRVSVAFRFTQTFENFSLRLPLDPIFLRFRSFRFSFPRFDLNSCKNNNPNSIASQRNNVESMEKETKRT